MRLIDADTLKKEFPHDEDWNYQVNTNSFVVETIDKAPTINPVKHGRWMVSEDELMECSGCKWLFSYWAGLEEEWNYCPHCGAKMYGEKAGDAK